MHDDEPLAWATTALEKLDDLVPGVVRRAVTAAPLIRQAIFLSVAHLDMHSSGGLTDQPERLNALAHVLRRGWAKDILREAGGAIPDGALSVLERIGSHPLRSARAYQWLWMTLSSPNAKADVLRSLAEVTDRSVHVLEELGGVLVHPEVVKRVESVVQARELTRAVRFIQSVCTKATDEVLAQRFARMRTPNALPVMLHGFLRQADRFPPPPFTGDDQLLPINSARDLIEAGRRLRNCLALQIGEVLVGRVAFGEFVGGSQPAICEFRVLSGGRGWLLSEVHVQSNGFVPPPLRAAAQQKCAELGIAYIEMPDAGEWRSARRIIHQVEAFPFAA